MRSSAMVVVIGLALAIGAAPAAAQQRARTAGRVPDTGMGGIGISFGAAVSATPASTMVRSSPGPWSVT